MALQILRGIKAGAVRTVLYGTEGIGKSTLAAQIPDSLIVDIEDGAGQIDHARAIALDWRAIEHATKELIADPQGFKAVIYDTADWLEKALIDHVLKQSGKKSIEDFGYGKGYVVLQEHVTRFLALTDQLIAKGIHVVFVAHAKVTRTSPPDQTDGYDRYELKLTKHVAPILKEWADMVLFCNYQIQIVEGTDGKLKAQGGKSRVIHCVRSAAWDAKNRFGLPDEIQWGASAAEAFSHLAHIYKGAQPRQVSAPAKKAQEEIAATNAALESDPGELPGLATPEQIAELDVARATKIGAQIIEDAMEKLNAIDLGEFTTEQADQLLKDIAAATEPAETTQTMFPEPVMQWLKANAQIASAYLLHVKWLKPGQSYYQLDQENANAIADKFDKFKNAALNHSKLTGGKKGA